MTRRFFASGSKLRGVLSQEDEDLNPGPDGSAGTEEALATLAAEGEANEAEAEAAESEAMVENAMDGVVALEELRMEIWAANQNGGLNRGGAAIARRHANLILRNMLGEKEPLTMPTMESFGGTGDQISSGVMTMESISTTIKNTWAQIIKWLKKIREKVKAWLYKIFGAAEKLGKRAEAIKKRADNVKGTAKEKTIDNDSIFNSLATKGVLDASNIKAGMGLVVALTDSMVTASTDSNKLVTDVIDVFDTVKDDASFVTAAGEITKLKTAFGRSLTNIKPPDGTQLPGNVSLRHPKDAGSAANGDQRMEGFGLPANAEKAKTGAKVPTLDTDTIGSICMAVKNISESLVAARKVEPASEKANKALDTFAQKHAASSNLDDSKIGANKEAYNGLVKEFKSISGSVDGPVKSLAGYCLKTARSALDYCDASLGQYESA